MRFGKFNIKYCVLLPIVLIITIFLWFAPSSFFGSLGDVLTVTQQRTIAIFAFAALMWIFEIVPNWVTSLMVIVISLLTISDKSISFCLSTGDASAFVPMKELMRSFADPVVMLFLGGFVLAIVAAKYGMDVTMARILLRPFGKKPRIVLLGVLIVISVFSMFMSNTATAAMFLAFLAPVFASLPDSDREGKVGIALAIPVAANIGGIGTPIGTPPNATAVGNLDSLAGITISLNLVIDNTIVMADHVRRRHDLKAFLSILAATLTTVGALVIIFFMDEKIRLNLQDFAAVVIINLLISLF